MTAIDRLNLDTQRQPGRPSSPLCPLAEVAHERLRGAGYLALRDVACEFSGDEARLVGRLPSHYLKQVAQAIVAGLAGVRTILNQIEVTQPPRRTAIACVAAEPSRASR